MPAANKPTHVQGKTAPHHDDDGVSCCSWICGVNFSKPTRREASIVTQASLVAAAAFCGVDLYGVVTSASSGTIENFVQSFLDFISTAVVLYRLAASDALVQTARNEVLERRTSMVLGFTMIALGAVFAVFAVESLLREEDAETRLDRSSVSMRVMLAVPAALIYLIVGMMQLQLSWVLELRSLKQDAIISIMGALVAIGTLAAALANMILWLNEAPKEMIPALAHPNYRERLQNANSTAEWISMRDEANAALEARHAQHFRYWWLEDFFSLVNGVILLLFGISFIVEDTRAGVTWWSVNFWCAPLPAPQDKSIRSEHTPLYNKT